MGSIDKVRLASIYDDQGTVELSGTQIGSFNVDISNTNGAFGFNTTAGPNGSYGQGIQYEIKGDWLYIDPSSIGAAQAVLSADNEDSRTLALAPGAVFKFSFDRIRVFSTPASGAPALTQAQPNIQNPYIRVFYGLGDCPFEEKSLLGSTSPVIYLAPTGAVNLPGSSTSGTIFVPSGALVSAGLTASQTTSAMGNSSILRCNLIITMIDGASGYSFAPDFQDRTDQASGAATGTARVSAKWFPFRMPRGALSLVLRINNFGTEAANNVTLGSGFIQVA